MTLKDAFDKIDSGDIIEATIDSPIHGKTTKKFKVGRRSKSEKYKVEKITLTSPSNIKGLKYYIYRRKSGNVTMAAGDMAVMGKTIKIIQKKKK